NPRENENGTAANTGHCASAHAMKTTASAHLHRGMRSVCRLIALVLMLAQSALAAEPQPAATSTNLLLIDRFGKDVLVPTNHVPPSLQPSEPADLQKQIPTTPKGKPLPESVQKRIAESKIGPEWFPTTPPILMPYLGSLDEFGNTAVQPGAAIPIE